MKFLVVDDSPSIAELVKALLQSVGHTAEVRTSSVQALADVSAIMPDAVVLDLMMPGMDGFELCKRLREKPELAQTKIVILSGKAYEFDRRRAKQLGADGYIVKPIRPDTFLEQLDKIIADALKLTYWGTHGTLPVPGPKTVRYGGNTSCVTLEAQGEPLLIFDAGTGIKSLSRKLMQKPQRLTAKIFITHPHWDHINCLPFFTPLYLQGNEIEVLGCPHGSSTTREIISAQMDDVYFPITMREFGARLFFRDLREERIEVGGFRIETLMLSHPGSCLGYRVWRGDRSVCYITDNELFPKDSDFYNPEFDERITRFVEGTDILITDTNYLDEDYRARIGWGHSCVREVVSLAHRAKVKSLHLFHHDPDQDDDAIDRKLRQAEERKSALGGSFECVCPAEGEEYAL